MLSRPPTLPCLARLSEQRPLCTAHTLCTSRPAPRGHLPFNSSSPHSLQTNPLRIPQFWCGTLPSQRDFQASIATDNQLHLRSSRAAWPHKLPWWLRRDSWGLDLLGSQIKLALRPQVQTSASLAQVRYKGTLLFFFPPMGNN